MAVVEGGIIEGEFGKYGFLASYVLCKALILYFHVFAELKEYQLPLFVHLLLLPIDCLGSYCICEMFGETLPDKFIVTF